VWGQERIWWPKYITKSSPMYEVSELGTRVWMVPSAKITIVSLRQAYPYSRWNQSWLPIKYTVDPCHITIQSVASRNTQRMYISKPKIYMYSIHLQEVNDTWWLDMRPLEIEKRLQDIQNSGGSVIWAYDFTTHRSLTTRQEQTRGFRWSGRELHWFQTRTWLDF